MKVFNNEDANEIPFYNPYEKHGVIVFQTECLLHRFVY